MSMLKFAFSEHAVDGTFTDEGQPTYNPKSKSALAAAEQFATTVKSAKRIIKKSSDFLYVRTRAIGSLEKWGPNMNGDAFPMKELTASYKSFVGKGNFIDHKSDDITKIRGLVIDAFLNTDDHCVECLIAVDKKSHPQLARDIETGAVHSVSMGTRVGWSECSCCGNVARTEKDYCSHIASYKGMKVGFLNNNAAHQFGKFAVHEVNHDLEFIELSWVAVPAFADAFVLEKIASKNGSETLSNRYESDGGVSESEHEMFKFASSRTSVPEDFRALADVAACRDSECDFDARKSNNNNRGVKMASEMNRIRITREEVGYRTVPKDYVAKGSVMIDTKEHKWWASSSDKAEWMVHLEDGLGSISASGQSQIIKAIKEMITKSVDSTDLVVASGRKNLKTAWLQGEDDALAGDLAKKVADGKPIYDPKDLDTKGGPVRNQEEKAYSETAKEGPSGALGKPLSEKDETLKSSEHDLKEEYQRAWIKYKTLKKLS
jgi:hypothetical protein